MKSPIIFAVVLAVQIAGIFALLDSVTGNLIVLSDTAVQSLGGTFLDLFGTLTTPTGLPVGVVGKFVSTDLKGSNFLLTGQDPFFNASRDVRFLLYTNQNSNGVNVTMANIAYTTFNPSNPVRFFIHGYTEGPDDEDCLEFTPTYLARGDFNVIIVDWSYGAKDPNYLNARLRVNAVSIQVANLINSLIASGLTTYDQVVITGHSLGGQAAGLTGKKIIGGKVKAVIAMDPAGPFFPATPTKATVQPTDAQYVEAIHTNGGGFGMLNPCAQADFFPNGGSSQPGCDVTDVFCNHHRSYQYFFESINNDRFKAIKCASFSEIASNNCTDQGGVYYMGGEPPNSGISGIFYLKTASASPYALG